MNVTHEGRRFNPSEIGRIHRSLSKAVECLEAYYRFSPREWFHYGFDLRTARDLGPGVPPRPPHVLAEVARSVPRGAAAQEAKPAGGPPCQDVYAIVLYDANILRLTSGRPEADFDRLLLLILTHELVHIARFFHQADYDAPETERLPEETRVHRLTRRVLERLGDPELLALADAHTSGEYSF
ncbi:MAG: hypothetical protein KA419_03440 [Acidobacteria bacterium]|nr:hypothetical protein [Acidobacteriota bacterium]